MRLSRQVGAYIEGLEVGQGRHAGKPLRLLGWQRRFLAGAFGNEGDAALSMARGNGKTTFTAAIACSAVDVGGPLVEQTGPGPQERERVIPGTEICWTLRKCGLTGKLKD